MENTVTDAKAEFTRAKDRLARSLSTTPDDKVNWSPSETARTPVAIVAHAAMGTAWIQSFLSGGPMPAFAEMDRLARESEVPFTTREQAMEILEKNANEYLVWLDSLTPEQLGSVIESPMGTFPMAMGITFAADHMRVHSGQIDYIQTIYGDRDWHMS